MASMRGGMLQGKRCRALAPRLAERRLCYSGCVHALQTSPYSVWLDAGFLNILMHWTLCAHPRIAVISLKHCSGSRAGGPHCNT